MVGVHTLTRRGLIALVSYGTTVRAAAEHWARNPMACDAVRRFENIVVGMGPKGLFKEFQYTRVGMGTSDAVDEELL
ncbi:hypothetical protein F5Y19DRAFT_413591 [Xylariaceae sp. FL1651]|nr:hypothetical protein F5Y19DRAFT_413591 [Xylariaceae sp. FL1651]